MKRNRVYQTKHNDTQPDQTEHHATTPITPPLVITEIPDKAFEHSTILPPTFVIPNTIVRIGNSAFSHSFTLVNVFIPNSVIEIGSGAFCSCHNLEAINLPNSLQRIGRCAFGCTALKSVNFPISLNKVHNYSFCHNFKLAKVNLPITIRKIGEGAFTDCVALESIRFPKLLDTIGESSFCNNQFRTLEIPLSVSDIGEEAFQDCKQLVSVLIPEQLGFQLCVEECDDWDDNHDLDVSNSSSVMYEYTKQSIKERNNSGQDEEITINTNAFANCARLVSIFLADDNIVCAPGAFECCESLDERDLQGKNSHYDTETWLRQRFDDLPIHRMCYFDSKYMMKDDSLKRVIQENKETLMETDAMGMTALHILCCNPTVTLDAVKQVKSANPAAVRARNVQGKSPYMLLLICQNLLPTNIVPSCPSDMKFSEPCSCIATIDVKGEGVIEIVPTMHEFLKSGIRLRQLEIVFEFDEDEDVHESLGVSLETRDKESGLFPFMKAATLPHCGLGILHFLAMRSLNILT